MLSPSTLRLCPLLLALALAGCASDTSGAEAEAARAGEVDVRSNETDDLGAIDNPDLRAEADTTGPPRVTVAGTTVPARGVVTDIESGDRSCYITLRTDTGATETVHADYSVCDTNVIKGRRVQIEYVPDTILAASCEGDPDCLDTETVALAVVAMPID
ncbi:hypothetical protein [Rubrivirga sp. IMCC45206]|uniref:hypothetical protein n=1 Tax=Rubrivirga sp. IMCC45206 TaxID=3391614 RepID=UPI0039902B1F